MLRQIGQLLVELLIDRKYMQNIRMVSRYRISIYNIYSNNMHHKRVSLFRESV